MPTNANLLHRTTAESQTPTPRHSSVTQQRLRRRSPASWIALVVLLTLPGMVKAQYFNYFNYTTNNNGAITITGYTGPGGAVAIPWTINGLWVTSIGDNAFGGKTGLTSIWIPNSVTSIGAGAFFYCLHLASITVPPSVTNLGAYAFSECWLLTNITIGFGLTTIGAGAFQWCESLPSITIPSNVTTIGDSAFAYCIYLTNATIGSGVSVIGAAPFGHCGRLKAITVDALNPFYVSVDGVLFDESQTMLIQCRGAKDGSYTIPGSVTNIGTGAFAGCYLLTNIMVPAGVTSIGDSAFEDNLNLATVYFQGNAPNSGARIFYSADKATVYYLPWTLGWGPTFGGRPTALWRPQVQTTDASFGVRANQFGFNIAWASGMSVVVEGSTNLGDPVWLPLRTITLTNGLAKFSDPQGTNYPARFYRLRWP